MRRTLRGLVVIPAYNEAASLPAVLAALAGCGYGLDVVVVDDCSTDGTAAAARAAGVRLLRHAENRGYRHALRTGMRHALEGGYEAVIFLDADGQHRPASVADLLSRATADDEPEVVIGSRYVGPQAYSGPLGRRLGQKLLSLLCYAAAAVRIWDTTSGLKLLRRRAIELIMSEWGERGERGEAFCDLHAEAIVYLLRAGLRVVEVPISFEERRTGESMYGWTSAIRYPAETLWAMAQLLPRAQRARARHQTGGA